MDEPSSYRIPLHRRPGAAFWLLLLLYAGMRLVQALAGPVSYDDEEGYTLAAAWELLRSPSSLPYQAYQLSDWECGSLLTVLLTAPLAALLGPGLFTLKVTALLTSLVTLGALYLLCRDGLGSGWTALLACAIYALFPGPILHYSLTAHGFHADSMGLQLLFLWQVLAVLDRERVSGGRLLLCGALGGLALYYAYISVAALLAGCLLLLGSFLRLPRAAEALGRLGWFCAGLSLGAAPLLIYNAANDWSGLFVYGTAPLYDFVTPDDLGSHLAFFRVHTLELLRHFANYQQEGQQWLDPFCLYFWALAAAGTLGPLVPFSRLLGRARAHGPCPAGAEPRLQRLVLLFILASLALFFLSGHLTVPAHFVPLLVVLLIPVAWLLGTLLRRSGAVGKVVGVALLAPLLGVGARVNGLEVEAALLGIGPHVDGRNYPLLLERLRDLHSRTQPRAVRRDTDRWVGLPLEWAKTEPPRPGMRMTYYGDMTIAMALRGREDITALGRYLQRRPAEYSRGQQLQVAGFALGRLMERGQISAQEARSLAGALPARERAVLYQGMGFSLDPAIFRGWVDRHGGSWPEPEGPAGGWQGHLAMGIGRGFGLVRLLEQQLPFCGEPLPASLRGAFFEGLGQGLACRLTGPPPPQLTVRLCATYRAELARGFDHGRRRCPPGGGL